MRTYAQPVRPAENLTELLNHALERDPDAVFVFWLDGSRRIEKTYSDLSTESGALAGFLNAKYGSGNRIAIIGENCYEWIAAFFAVVRSGNIAVAVNRQLPEEQRTEMIQNSRCTVCICQEPADQAGCDEYLFSQLAEAAESSGFANKAYQEPDVHRTAAIFFTSGTSGACKGVCLSQKNMMSVVNAACQAFAPRGASLSVLPFHHVLGLIVSILMPMQFPYPVCLNRSLRTLQRDFAETKPQTVIVVPLFIESFYKQIRNQIRQSGKEKQLIRAEKLSRFLLRFGIDIRKRLFREIRNAFGGSLEVLICGGAEIAQRYIDYFEKYGIIVLNGYGMTETASVIAVNRLEKRKPECLGVPLSCCEIRCAEDGEIMVRGDCVMCGYDGQPPQNPDTWYPSGDLGRIDDDHFLYFTGRKKNLIVLSNGENVSPEGIERMLTKDCSVQEVVVFAENGYLAARIYPAPHCDGNAAVERYNAGQPPFLRIRKVIVSETPLPKNSSGKIIR